MDDILVFVLVLIVLNVAVRFCDADEHAHSTTSDIYGISMECKGSDVIQVLETELVSFKSICDSNKCNLTENDIEEIRSCTGLKSCRISREKLSTCLMDTGFFDVVYSCQRYTPTTCDFEKGECGWFDEQKQWSRIEANDGTWYNGPPKRDHTTGSSDGFYMFVKLNNAKSGSLRNSEVIYPSTVQCLTFYYYMSRKDKVLLNVYQTNATGGNKKWTFRKTTEHLWNYGRVNLDKTLGHFFLIFEALKKEHWNTYVVAIDDIEITNSACDQAHLINCDFENSMCDFKGRKWTRYKGSSFQVNRDPRVDHTFTSNDGYFAFMDGKQWDAGKATNLTSPLFDTHGFFCFTFWYFINDDIIGLLKVYTNFVHGESNLKWNASEQNDAKWYLGFFDVDIYEPLKIVFEGIDGGSWYSGIAIDDVKMVPGKCSGMILEHHKCIKTDKDVVLKRCAATYIDENNLLFKFDSFQRKCFQVQGNISSGIACNQEDEIVTCNVIQSVVDFPECFQKNHLKVTYNCTAQFSGQTAKETDSNTDNSVGLVVGVTIGVLLIVIVACTAIYICRRHRPTKMVQNQSAYQNYMGNQDIAMPSTGTQKSHSKLMDLKNKCYTDEHNDSSIETHVGYDGLNVSFHKGTSALSNNLNDNEEYTVINPSKTDFETEKPYAYDLASAINQAVGEGYAESEADHYDTSGQHQYRTNDTIYDRSVDDIYDSANQGREHISGNDTYDHMFGKVTDDDYDIARI